MAAPIFTRLEGDIPIARHDHVGVLYRGQSAAFRYYNFLAEGLVRGDSCHYLAPSSFHAEMIEKLRTKAPDLDGGLAGEILQLHSGPTGADQLRAWTQQAFEDAERSRTPAVRWLEEGMWPQPSAFPVPQFFESHALLNYQVKQYASAALCQYDLEQIDPRHLFCAIAVHRHLILDETLVRDNPFYIPPEKFIPLTPGERERDLVNLFREVGFDIEKFLSTIAGFGRLQRDA